MVDSDFGSDHLADLFIFAKYMVDQPGTQEPHQFEYCKAVVVPETFENFGELVTEFVVVSPVLRQIGITDSDHQMLFIGKMSFGIIDQLDQHLPDCFFDAILGDRVVKPVDHGDKLLVLAVDFVDMDAVRIVPFKKGHTFSRTAISANEN
jgi:hypothetical protein